MPLSASAGALADRHGRRRHLLSRGGLFQRAWGPTPTLLSSRLPPLADAVVCKRWRACRPAWPQAPFTFSQGSFPTRVGPHPHAFELKAAPARRCRSEEHTSELQSPCNLVCRLLLEKKKKIPFCFTTENTTKKTSSN